MTPGTKTLETPAPPYTLGLSTFEPDVIAKFTQDVSPLLAEYVGKLKDAVREMRELVNMSADFMPAKGYSVASSRSTVRPHTHHHNLASAIRFMLNILPPAKALARFVSPVLEHAPPGVLPSLELALRSAEFNSAILDCEEMLNLGRSAMGS